LLAHTAGARRLVLIIVFIDIGTAALRTLAAGWLVVVVIGAAVRRALWLVGRRFDVLAPFAQAALHNCLAPRALRLIVLVLVVVTHTRFLVLCFSGTLYHRAVSGAWLARRGKQEVRMSRRSR
jgi:hypothetical protein